MDISDLIATGIKPPQVDDLATAQAKQLTLGNLRQEQTLNRQKQASNTQTLASGAIALQQQQQDQADQQAINTAVATNTTTDPVTGQPKLDRPGILKTLSDQGRGNAALKVQAQFTATDEAQAKLAAATIDAQTKGLTLTTQRATRLAELAGAVEAAPPEGKQDAYSAMIASGLHEGLITPAMRAQFPTLYDPSQDTHLHNLVIGAQSAATQADIALKNVTASKDKADTDNLLQQHAETWRVTAATQAANAQSQPDLDAIRARLAASGAPPAALAQIPAMFSPAAMTELGRSAMTAEQRTQADQATANAAETAKRDQNAATNDAARLRIEGAAQFLRQKTFDATLGQGLDANGQPKIGVDGKPMVSPAAQMAADYQVPVTPYMIARMPGLMAQIKTANPDYDAKNYDAAKQIRTGSASANTQALNTAIVHLDQLGEAGKAMQNGPIQPGNALYNSLVTTFGANAVTNFDSLKAAVAGEMATALKGNATDVEITNVSKNVQSMSSPEQLAGFVQTNLPILAAKLNTRDEQYHQAVGARDPWHPLLPTAKAVLAKYGVGTVPDVSAGTTYAHTASGANGHKIGTNDGKTWFDVQTGQQVK